VSALGTARPSARANAVFVGNSTGRIFCFGGRSVLGDVNGSTVSDQSVYILDSANGNVPSSLPPPSVLSIDTHVRCCRQVYLVQATHQRACAVGP